MPPKEWKTREELAILSQVHTNTVSTWLNDNKEKYKSNLEQFKNDIANKEKNKWFINPKEFFKSYPKKITYDHSENFKEFSSNHPPLNALHTSSKEQAKLDSEEGQGILVSSNDLAIAHNVRDAFGKIGYVIEPRKPYYHRAALWLILFIIALIVLFVFAYFEHKTAIIEQKKQIGESYKALISSREEQYNAKINALEIQYQEKLSYQAQLNQKDLQLKLKDVELVKSELDKSKILTQQQKSQLAETKREISKLNEELSKLKLQEEPSSDISTTISTQ